MKCICKNDCYRIRTLGFLVLVILFMGEAYSQRLRVGVVGLTHDHAHGIMQQYKRGEVIIAGIVEPNRELVDRYKKRYQLQDALFFESLSQLLEKEKLDAVLAYNAIAEHLAVVEACAPQGISVMVEKPLAATVEQAERMAALAKQFRIKILTNYETTWYSSFQQMYDLSIKEQSIGDIRKMVVHMGHQGPKEIGCSPEFLQWLTDPVKNGGGAVIDFGCYGANLMTWLMKGKAPVAVSAVLKQIKPGIYPNVDDDATILLEYPEATGIVEASWNWPYGIKDLELFGKSGYLHGLNGNEIVRRDTNTYYKLTVKPAVYRDNLTYLAAVLKGEFDPGNDLSSLENNLIVVRILDAARRSAREGKRIVL